MFGSRCREFASDYRVSVHSFFHSSLTRVIEKIAVIKIQIQIQIQNSRHRLPNMYRQSIQDQFNHFFELLSLERNEKKNELKHDNLMQIPCTDSRAFTDNNNLALPCTFAINSSHSPTKQF